VFIGVMTTMSNPQGPGYLLSFFVCVKKDCTMPCMDSLEECVLYKDERMCEPQAFVVWTHIFSLVGVWGLWRDTARLFDIVSRRYITILCHGEETSNTHKQNQPCNRMHLSLRQKETMAKRENKREQNDKQNSKITIFFSRTYSNGVFFKNKRFFLLRCLFLSFQVNDAHSPNTKCPGQGATTLSLSQQSAP